MQHNRVLVCVLGAAAALAVLIVFNLPLASLWPFALILVCPLMMIVMMKRMAPARTNHAADDRDHDSSEPSAARSKALSQNNRSAARDQAQLDGTRAYEGHG